MTQEGGQWGEVGVFFGRFEVARCANQFLKVFHPCLTLFTFFFLVIDDQPGLFEGGLRHGMQRHVFDFGCKPVDQLDECTQGAGSPALERLCCDQLAHRLPHRYLAVTCMLANGLDGFLANTAWRHVDHALQRGIVTAAFNQSQVGHGILDLCPLEEALATIDAVRNPLAQQGFLKHPRLGVRAIQNSHFVTRVALLDQAFNGLDHITRFVMFVVGGVQRNGFTLTHVGPQFLA